MHEWMSNIHGHVADLMKADQRREVALGRILASLEEQAKQLQVLASNATRVSDDGNGSFQGRRRSTVPNSMDAPTSATSPTNVPRLRGHEFVHGPSQTSILSVCSSCVEQTIPSVQLIRRSPATHHEMNVLGLPP